MSRVLVQSVSGLLTLMLLGACGRTTEAPVATTSTEIADLVEAVTTDAASVMPKPSFSGALAGEPFLAEAEQSCILERNPISGQRQFVLSFERPPEDALILHIPEQKAETPMIAEAYLLRGERYLQAKDQALDAWTITDQNDGWLLSGEFELDFAAPVAADARVRESASTGPAEPDSAAVAPVPFRDGQFDNLYCLDLDRLKALGGGPEPAPAVN